MLETKKTGPTVRTFVLLGKPLRADVACSVTGLDLAIRQVLDGDTRRELQIRHSADALATVARELGGCPTEIATRGGREGQKPKNCYDGQISHLLLPLIVWLKPGGNRIYIITH